MGDAHPEPFKPGLRYRSGRVVDGERFAAQAAVDRSGVEHRDRLGMAEGDEGGLNAGELGGVVRAAVLSWTRLVSLRPIRPAVATVSPRAECLPTQT